MDSVLPCHQRPSGFVSGRVPARAQKVVGRCAISEAHITYGRRKAFPRGFCDCRVTEGIAYIEVERARLCEQFLVHELAHVIAWPSDHGPAFVSALLDLTHYVFWPGARAQLRQWMRDEGVKMR